MNITQIVIDSFLAVVALLSLLIGLLVYARNTQQPLNWKFWLLCLATFLWTSTNLLFVVFDGYTFILALLSYASAAFLVLAFLFFCLEFARIRLRPIVSKVLLAAGIEITLISLIPGVVGISVDPESGIVTNKLGLIIYAAYIIAFLGGGLLALMRAAIREKGTRGNQANIVLFGFSSSVVIGLACNLILPLRGNYSFVELGPAAAIFFVGATAYAIIKQRLFDLKFVAARAVAYLLTFSTILPAYVLAVYGLALIVFTSSRYSSLQGAINLSLVFIFALTFQPLKRLFDKVTDKLFFRESYEPQTVLNKLGEVIVNETNLEKLVHSTLALLNQSIRSNSTELILVQRGGGYKAYGGDSSTEPGLPPKHLESMRGAVVARDLIEFQHPRLYSALHQANIALAAKLTSSNGLMGYLVLGDKVSGDAYSTRDVNLISVLANELAVAIENCVRFQEIQEFNETLQRRIDEATQKLTESNKKLHDLDTAKDEFISMASHQLRTPLTSVKGYLSMVLEGDAGEVPAAQRKLLEEAYASSQRMVYLIGDFLNVSRLQTGKFVLETSSLNMAKLISEEMEQLKQTAAGKQLTLRFEAPENFPDLELDQNKIRQVIMNLIDNAIYYSKPGTTITIELLQAPGEIVFRVRDHGIGVPKGEQHHLFTKFYRASNARRVRPDGTGIGLFMAKKVIIAHGGTVIFETKEGEGSVFGFRLPIKK